MEKGRAKIQIGKNGLTEGLLTAINNAFNTRKEVKINILKSATRNKKDTKKMAEKIIGFLEEEKEEKFDFETRGYTILIKEE